MLISSVVVAGIGQKFSPKPSSELMVVGRVIVVELQRLWNELCFAC